MPINLPRPRALAQRLRNRARVEPEEVEEFLDTHTAEWQSLAEANPHDAADILEELDVEAATDLLSDLNVSDAAGILNEMRPELSVDLLEELSPARIPRLISAMDADMAADLLGQLDDRDRHQILAELEPEISHDLIALLQHAPDSAGGLMTTDVAVLQVGLTAGEATERLRQLHDQINDLSYVYVVDHRRHLVGVVSFRDLVFARPGVGLEETMVEHPVSVRPETDREEVSELAQRYGLFGLPVVDHSGVLLGMVTHEAVVESVRAEASEDFAAAMGAGPEETVFTSVTRAAAMRLPWMVINLVMALVVAFVIERQSSVINDIGPILAALMPVVALMGGNAGAQSLAVVIRSMAIDGLAPSRAGKVLLNQVAIGLINSVPIGLLAGIVGYVFGGTFRFGLTMGVATTANLVIGTLSGTAIPLVLRRMGFDPALASNIFLTLVTDVVGFGGFLVVATLLLP
ncbi:MAG: magnesium transporter [bacterium]|nr:magnesium transporter [bacterium]